MVNRLRYLPKGSGSYHWLADASSGQRLFVTVDDLDTKPWLGQDRESTFAGLHAAYDTAMMLHREARLHFVVAPMLSLSGGTVVRLTERYSIAVFPFIDGEPGDWGDRLTQADHGRLIIALAELHRSTPSVSARALNPGLQLPGRATLEMAIRELGKPWAGGPFSGSARDDLATHADVVRSWLASYDDLVALVAKARTEPVITHGEPHPGNLIHGPHALLLVDWDTAALARPERDLWMLDDGTGASLTTYSEMTGRAIDHLAISLYRLRWTLSDIAAFIALFRSHHTRNRGTERKWTALRQVLRGVAPAPYSWPQD